MTTPAEKKNIAESVNEALAEDDTDPDTCDPITEELKFLWSELNYARRAAINGEWSMECSTLTYRIARLTSRTGKHTGWRDISFPLLVDGIWQEIHRQLGVNVETPDMTRVMEMHDRNNRQVG